MKQTPEIAVGPVAATSLFSKGEERLAARDVRAALGFYRRAEQSGYDADACAGARWLCHMLLGDFQSAWLESDAIASRGRPDPNRFWSGQPLNGKRVLVRCLHGLGDTLQYLRYVPLLQVESAGVVIEAQPPLKALLVAARCADEVITWGDPEPPWDEQVEVVELPLIFRSTLETLPAAVPYLFIPRAVRARSARPRIGLLWAAGAFNPQRSIPLPLFASLTAIDGAEFYSFQQDPARADLRSVSFPIRDAAPADSDVLETARRLSGMDLVITADTMLAHLAGALGLPVWVLLPYAADWRWMLDRRDSPWYPTMRLFRQPRPQDWLAVVTQATAELKSWLAISSATPVAAPAE